MKNLHDEQGKPKSSQFNLSPTTWTYMVLKAATMLDWLVMIKINNKTAAHVEHWCGELPSWAKALCTWGEAGV
eukprot:5825992-Ditylum_brightwellii.AAC.1